MGTSTALKAPGRNKGYISEIKKNLQGTNSGGNEAENQINNLEHRKKKALNQNSKKKKELKRMKIA